MEQSPITSILVSLPRHLRLTLLTASAPGELHLNLSVHAPTEMKLLRPSQEDLTVCMVENLLPAGSPETLKELLQEVASSETIRSYSFYTLQGTVLK